MGSGIGRYHATGITALRFCPSESDADPTSCSIEGRFVPRCPIFARAASSSLPSILESDFCGNNGAIEPDVTGVPGLSLLSIRSELARGAHEVQKRRPPAVQPH
jgi:hypothetical protein